MTDRHINLDAAIQVVQNNLAFSVKADIIKALSALPAVSGWLNIESAKTSGYVMGRIAPRHEDDQWAHLSGRWFVVWFIRNNDWSLYPGMSVGDNWFDGFLPLPAPPEIE